MSALPVLNRASINRAAVNRANAEHSTGPRTDEGKARSSRNALCHGLSTIGLHGARLSRQFQKTLQQLRELQADRLERRAQDLKQTAAILELLNHKGLPYGPARDGFVFSIDEVEAPSQRLMRQNEARAIAYFRFECDPRLAAAAGR